MISIRIAAGALVSGISRASLDAPSTACADLDARKRFVSHSVFGYNAWSQLCVKAHSSENRIERKIVNAEGGGSGA